MSGARSCACFRLPLVGSSLLTFSDQRELCFHARGSANPEPRGRALEGIMKIQELIELFDKSMKDCDLYEIGIKGKIRDILDDLKQNEYSREEIEKRQYEILILDNKLVRI